jgi:hypothetical protein
MFTMMNNARLGVGIEGLSQCELALQKAISFSKNRKQGKAQVPHPTGTIIDHADVRRNILTMKALTSVVRALCLDTAISLDLSKSDNSEYRNFQKARADFLIPIAKAFSTEIGCKVADIGIQVHGGMGYIEETGIAQVYRDVRVTAIYEGTNGIQSADLVGRKISDDGKIGFEIINEIEDTIKRAKEPSNTDFSNLGDQLSKSLMGLESALNWMTSRQNKNDCNAGGMPFLRAFGYILGAHYLLKAAMISSESDRKNLASFYFLNILPIADANAVISKAGSKALYNFSDRFFG